MALFQTRPLNSVPNSGSIYPYGWSALALWRLLQHHDSSMVRSDLASAGVSSIRPNRGLRSGLGKARRG